MVFIVRLQGNVVLWGIMQRNKKRVPLLKLFLRYLADSNRRTRFCRPLTKPLIQGTGLLSDDKGKTFFVKNKQRAPFFVF